MTEGSNTCHHKCWFKHIKYTDLLRVLTNLVEEWKRCFRLLETDCLRLGFCSFDVSERTRYVRSLLTNSHQEQTEPAMLLLLKAKAFNWTINRSTMCKKKVCVERCYEAFVCSCYKRWKQTCLEAETQTGWGVRVFRETKTGETEAHRVRVCLGAAKSRRSGGSRHRKKYYLQLLSRISPASNAVLSVVLSVMPIFRRPCFHEIKRHVIAPRVNSVADWTIQEAEKLFTACKWPSERPSHHKTNHASSSLAVSMGGGWTRGNFPFIHRY